MTEEVRRYGVIAATVEGKMTNREAAAVLGICVRQIKRLKMKVKKEGPLGIRHGNRDKRSPKAFPEVLRKRVIMLAKKKYFDFNFSHLSEMLKEQEDIRINRELCADGFVRKGSEARYAESASTAREENARRRKALCSFWMDLPICGSGMKRAPSCSVPMTQRENPFTDFLEKKKTLRAASGYVSMYSGDSEDLLPFISIGRRSLKQPAIRVTLLNRHSSRER